mmetsp:Transcript_11007/g.13323  ORF Transcript_11007/g.13323 Transcript_11007/m.13323 type:complete len:107 (+) Transcript_11007:803-1123(+)
MVYLRVCKPLNTTNALLHELHPCHWEIIQSQKVVNEDFKELQLLPIQTEALVPVFANHYSHRCACPQSKCWEPFFVLKYLQLHFEELHPQELDQVLQFLHHSDRTG